MGNTLAECTEEPQLLRIVALNTKQFLATYSYSEDDLMQLEIIPTELYFGDEDPEDFDLSPIVEVIPAYAELKVLSCDSSVVHGEIDGKYTVVATRTGTEIFID